MKHARSLYRNTIYQLVLVATIGFGTALKADDGLPHPGFEITSANTALLVTDPQNDFLSPDDAAWGVVAANVCQPLH